MARSAFGAYGSTGPQRGQSFCYICDTADKPAAIIFAKSLTEPLGKLAAKIDQAVADGVVPEMRTWLTWLDDGKQADLDRRLVEWGRLHALRTMPLGIFEDETGPPAYRLNRDAQATVLINLAATVPPFADQFARVAEFLDARPEVRAAGRERFKAYRARQIEPQTHNV